MNTKSKASILIVILLSLSLVACSTSQVITDIQIAADLVAVGAPVVAAFGGPSAYMTAAATGLNCVLTAAEMPGATTASIAASFASCFASVITPPLTGLSPQVAAIIVAVAAAINFLVTKYGPKSLRATGAPVKVKLTFEDHRRIGSMRKQMDQTLKTLAAK